MKKNRIVVIALAVLMVFAAVSCKDEPVHEHVYSQEWKSDATNHWHECECGEKKDVATHDLVWMIVEGERYQECSVCSYTTEKIEVLTAVDEASLRVAISDGSKPIYLLDDIKLSIVEGKTAPGSIVIDSGNTLLIDLNGKSIDLNGAIFYLNGSGEADGGSLCIDGEGSVKSKAFTFFIRGNSDSSRSVECNLRIGEKVKVEGDYAISVYPEDKKTSSYDVKIDIYGTVSGEQPIYVQGNINNTDSKAVQINIHDNARIVCTNESPIYLAGYAKTSIGKAEISSEGDSIVVSAGELELTEAIITGGRGEGFDAGSGGSVSTKTSSAIYVKQHSTNLPVKVVINSGSFSAYIPFYQDAGQSSSPKPELIEISIKGGNFIHSSTAEGSVSIKSENKTGFISGGVFSSEPDGGYIADGYKAVMEGTNWKVVSK